MRERGCNRRALRGQSVALPPHYDALARTLLTRGEGLGTLLPWKPVAAKRLLIQLRLWLHNRRLCEGLEVQVLIRNPNLSCDNNHFSHHFSTLLMSPGFWGSGTTSCEGLLARLGFTWRTWLCLLCEYVLYSFVCKEQGHTQQTWPSPPFTALSDVKVETILLLGC